MDIKIAFIVVILALPFAHFFVAQGAVQMQATPSESGEQNGLLNPLLCGSLHPPTWCSGADLGAWINAALAHMPGNGITPHGCGVIQLPYQSSLRFTTTIVKPRCTLIDLNQSTILWSGSSREAIIVADTYTAAPPNPGGIRNGRIFGGTGGTISISNGIFLGGDPAGVISPYGAGANNQSFDDLVVQNFTDNYVVGNNAYQDTWLAGTIALSGRAGIHFIAKGYNEGENFSFHGTTFLNNQRHDVLVDAGAFAEINALGAAFDYASRDSISSSGQLFVNASSSHFERKAGAQFIDCQTNSGPPLPPAICSINIEGGSMYMFENPTSSDAFAKFGTHGSHASFSGVDFAVGNIPLTQMFLWNDTSGTGWLSLLNFRQELGASLLKVPAYNGSSAPQIFYDSRALTANRILTNQTAIGASRLASGTDLNTVTQCGLYDTAGAVHGPAYFGKEFFHFQVLCSKNPEDQHQVAYDMVGGTNRSFIRHETAGKWSPWVEELSADDAGGQEFGGNVILPATLTGYHGNGGVKVQLSDGTGTAEALAVFAGDGSVTTSRAGAAGHITCWKAVGKLGYCSSAVSADGTCSCN